MKRGLISILGISVLATFTACEAPRQERHDRRVVVSRPPPVVREREYVRTPVVVRQAPPAVVEEVIPPSPGRSHVWTSGYWVSNNGRWMWQPGQWVLPPRERAVWVPGQWVDHRGDWQWVPGQWR